MKFFNFHLRSDNERKFSLFDRVNEINKFKNM